MSLSLTQRTFTSAFASTPATVLRSQTLAIARAQSVTSARAQLFTSRAIKTPLAAPTITASPVPAPKRRALSSTSAAMSAANPQNFDKPVASLTTDHVQQLPDYCSALFSAKKNKALTFEELGKALGRDEVAVAALFYGQAKASAEDVQKLSQILDLPNELLHSSMYGWPDRGRSIEMPPKEPLMYRLYEIVQNYGYAYKAILNEKFGDGIMSAISFSTNVKKETDEKGDWVVITLRGKWLPYTRF